MYNEYPDFIIRKEDEITFKESLLPLDVSKKEDAIREFGKVGGKYDILLEKEHILNTCSALIYRESAFFSVEGEMVVFPGNSFVCYIIRHMNDGYKVIRIPNVEDSDVKTQVA